MPGAFFRRSMLAALLLCAATAQADTLDDVYAFFANSVDGRTMYREGEHGAGGAVTRSENWFVMTNVGRSADIVTYEILFTARYVRTAAGSSQPTIDTESAHFYCRLGRRESTGGVVGYCAPDAATDRPIDGKAWTLIVTLESPTRLVLDEEITLYQDSPDPAVAGGKRPATGTSQIAIEVVDGKLVMTETARRWWVDPKTLARTAAGPPISLVSREVGRSIALQSAADTAELDRVHGWFADRIVGRELSWSDPTRNVSNWFTISNVYRARSELQYDILYASLRPKAPGSSVVVMEQVRWSCRLGARRTTAAVMGYCTTQAATDRQLVAKVSAMTAAVDGQTLVLTESTVGYVDVKDPGTGASVPGATESRIVIDLEDGKRLRMSETSTIFRVDPATGQRTVIREPATVVMRER